MGECTRRVLCRHVRSARNGMIWVRWEGQIKRCNKEEIFVLSPQLLFSLGPAYRL